MRHGNKDNHLGRKDGHRRALLANLAASLIMHKRINTTVAKAKALRMYVEPLITRSKDDTQHNRRTVFSELGNKAAVTELFKEVGPKVANRPGGYTRIIRYSLSISPKPAARRRGDSADMCLIELVDFNELMLNAKSEGKKAKTTRRGRGKSKAKATDTTAENTSNESNAEEKSE
ncbi:MAG TPA: 50S ribosomal protein L17 [Bacteroidia bacterium]|nr:50S ribosomal protein L17 [Bacteroidia bacterium]